MHNFHQIFHKHNSDQKILGKFLELNMYIYTQKSTGYKANFHAKFEHQQKFLELI